VVGAFALGGGKLFAVKGDSHHDGVAGGDGGLVRRSGKLGSGERHGGERY